MWSTKRNKKRTKWNNKRPDDWRLNWEGEITTRRYTVYIRCGWPLCWTKTFVSSVGQTHSIRFTWKLISTFNTNNKLLWPETLSLPPLTLFSVCAQHLRFVHLMQTWLGIRWNLLICAYRQHIPVYSNTKIYYIADPSKIFWVFDAKRQQ